jgi:Protein of unknown function (DUF2442)
MSKPAHLKQIERVRHMGDYLLAIVWRDGANAIIDLTTDIKSGGVWSGIRSDAKFANVRIGRRGRVVEWPDPADADGEPLIDIDADALYELAKQQKVQPLLEAVLEHIERRLP